MRISRRWFALQLLALALGFFYLAGSFLYSGGIPGDLAMFAGAESDSPLLLSYEQDALPAWALTATLGFVGLLFFRSFLRSLRLLARRNRHKPLEMRDDVDNPTL